MQEQETPIRLRMDGKEALARRGETLLEVARRIGVEIPTLCHGNGLSDFGGCRICVVEVEGRENLAPACSTPVEPGMVVHTASHVVIEARRLILGLLLEDHNLVCGECRAREDCALRRLAHDLGLRVSARQGDVSREVDGGIARVVGRCILCGKCVRVCAETQGACAIAFRGRGAKLTIGPPRDLSLRQAGCVLCRKCVEACPVGALEYVRTREERK